MRKRWPIAIDPVQRPAERRRARVKFPAGARTRRCQNANKTKLGCPGHDELGGHLMCPKRRLKQLKHFSLFGEICLKCALGYEAATTWRAMS